MLSGANAFKISDLQEAENGSIASQAIGMLQRYIASKPLDGIFAHHRSATRNFENSEETPDDSLRVGERSRRNELVAPKSESRV
jgi:hypothetical protein